MNVSYMAVLTKDELTGGEAVAMTFGNKLFGVFAFIIPLGVTISTLGSTMINQFETSRYRKTVLLFQFMLVNYSFEITWVTLVTKASLKNNYTTLVPYLLQPKWFFKLLNASCATLQSMYLFRSIYCYLMSCLKVWLVLFMCWSATEL